MKKILSILLFTLLMFAMSTTAFAVSDDCVMTVDGVEYTDFVEGWNTALAATANNDNVVEVVLYADWHADENGSFGEGKGFKKGAIYISEDTKDMSLDLNGHTISRGLFAWSDYDAEPTLDKSRDSGEVMHIDEGSKRITVKGGTITGANNKDYGGIYIDKAEVVFENIIFVSNKSAQGGALYNNEGNVSFKNCTFNLNRAEYGAAVYTDYKVLGFDGCTFTYNKASKEGTVYSYDADTTLSNCTFTNNNSGVRIATFGLLNTGDVVVRNCTFENNYVAISLRDGYLEVYDSTFDGNMYGIFIGADAKIKNCTFTNNKKMVISASGDAWVDNCTITNSGNDDLYALIYLALGVDFYLNDSTIQNNKGDCAIYMDSGVRGSTVAKLYISGKVIISDNFDANGQQANIMLDDQIDGCYIKVKDQLSKDSLIRWFYGRPNPNSYSPTVIGVSDEWSLEELGKVFILDEEQVNHDGATYYLNLYKNSIYMDHGNRAKDSSALPIPSDVSKARAASIFAEGSAPALFSLVAVAISVCALTISIVQKKKRISASSSKAESNCTE